ncbi:hypothetical protein F4859DRAFT_507102 [Xylaria cf. heliscus]|nr:hypothetical protein F4859DRAFT_507102 [Xylaria cf. heliscus]
MTDEPLPITLNEEPIEDGEFLTRNREGQRFRPSLVNRGNTLTTQVDIVGVAHTTGGHRFKKATVAFQFEDAGGSSASGPVVHAIVPKDRSALNKTGRVQNVEWGFNAATNIGMEEIKNETYYTAVSGEKRLMRRDFTGEANTVIWTLEENEHKSDGIPNFMRATVLLRRPRNVPFFFAVKVRADVDFIGEVKTLFGLDRKDPIDPVEIDPTNLPEADCASISSLDTKLHRLDKMDKLNIRKVGEVMMGMLLDSGGLTAAEHPK